ncbi:MAG: HDOD domain-containing protein [Gammaproteobacteria bacterium]|nr:HDOD domain-containing protein [Gammaproteobacteria bacterium]
MNEATQAFNCGFEFVTNLGEELNSGNLEIPAFPDVAVRIKNALADPEVTAEHVARVVGSDPIFSARLLKVANSAMVNGAGSRITDIRMAVTRMGFKMAYNTAVAIAVDQLLHSSSVEVLRPYLEDLWHHSMNVGALSYVIAKKLTKINPDEAMLAGLLHDIGKYYILTRSEQYPVLFSEPRMLDDIMKKWHSSIGRKILETWNFNEDTIKAAHEHEILDRMHFGPANLSDVVMIANLFSQNEEPHPPTDLDWETIPAMKRLEITDETASEIIEESRQQIQSIIQALESPGAS